MLKQPVPTPLRLSLGTALVGALTLGLAVTAWAAQPVRMVAGEVPPPPIVHPSDVESGKPVPPPPMVHKTDAESGRRLPPPPIVTREDVDAGRAVPPPPPIHKGDLEARKQVPPPPLPKAEAGSMEEDDAESVQPTASAPRPLLVSAPRYPEGDDGRDGGQIMLQVTVLPDGSPSDLKVVESQPPGVFDAVAIAAISSWQFEHPESGQPTQVLVPVKFAPEGQ